MPLAQGASLVRSQQQQHVYEVYEVYEVLSQQELIQQQQENYMK